MTDYGFAVNNAAGNPILDTSYPILHFIKKTTVTAIRHPDAGVYYYDYTPQSDADHMPFVAATCNQSDLYITCSASLIMISWSAGFEYQAQGKYRILVGQGQVLSPRTITLTIYEFGRLTNSHKMASGEYGLETYYANGDLLWSSKIPSAPITNWLVLPTQRAPYGDGNVLGNSNIGSISGYSSSRTYAAAMPTFLDSLAYDLSEVAVPKYLYPGTRFNGATIVGAGIFTGEGPYSGGFYYSDWALNLLIFDVTDL